MNILLILKILCALATIAVGLISFLRPRSIKGFTGLEAPGPRGIAEVRAVLGGLFIGLGLAPFLLPVPAVYQALGIAYLAIAVARTVSLFLDRSFERSNIISLVIEILFGFIFIL
ncbi:MAG: DUF4345 family protein [Anaerolineae bacterium]|nr:DUF4345 family protein [Anaerolineae bacterium]